MKKFKKKPVIIEAVLWDGKLSSLRDFEGLDGSREFYMDADDSRLRIATIEGIMAAAVGDWIIRGIKGELYPCKPDIFAATYEEVIEEERSDDTATAPNSTVA